MVGKKWWEKIEGKNCGKKWWEKNGRKKMLVKNSGKNGGRKMVGKNSGKKLWEKMGVKNCILDILEDIFNMFLLSHQTLRNWVQVHKKSEFQLMRNRGLVNIIKPFFYASIYLYAFFYV